MILVGALSVISWRRSPHRGRTAALECLRFLSALAVVLLLWQPEWLTTLHPDTKPQIAILWDDSKSMTTVDATLPPVLSEKSEVVSRADWVKKALASDLWKPLEANGANDLTALPFATPATPVRPSGCLRDAGRRVGHWRWPLVARGCGPQRRPASNRRSG